MYRNANNCLKVTGLVDIAYFIGGLLYYVGKNSPTQVLEYVLLGTAIMIYRLIPFFISKYYQSNLAKEHQTTEAKLQLVPEWILAAESLTLLVEFDAWYTIVVNLYFLSTDIEISCNLWQTKIIEAWLLWALFVLTYLLICTTQ